MGACYLCPEMRCLENAHLIPRYLFRGLIPTSNAIIDNTILLCPTHHSCLDTNRLTEDELNRLRPLIRELVPEFMKLLQRLDDVYAVHAETKSDKAMFAFVRKRERMFDKYLERLSTWHVLQ